MVSSGQRKYTYDIDGCECCCPLLYQAIQQTCDSRDKKNSRELTLRCGQEKLPRVQMFRDLTKRSKYGSSDSLGFRKRTDEQSLSLASGAGEKHDQTITYGAIRQLCSCRYFSYVLSYASSKVLASASKPYISTSLSPRHQNPSGSSEPQRDEKVAIVYSKKEVDCKCS